MVEVMFNPAVCAESHRGEASSRVYGPELDGGVPQGAHEGGPAGVHTPAGAAQ
jgi:hypothetical protein